MTDRVKLNKVSLRQQKQSFAMYRRFLPALEARKQQFLMQLAIVRKKIVEQEEQLKDLLHNINQWAPLYRDLGAVLRPHLAINELKVSLRNIAGLKVPDFHGIEFENPAYSYISTPATFEEVLRKSREAIECRSALKILGEQEKVLFEGFRKTSQRINLYEQRLIPQCKESIRKIVVYLQDQQAAAVGVAKVAKRMTEAAMLDS
ncbi:MAG: V-type ATP synthase subunit D [Deltaproteobacteria bacterium]|nr:V-type ATP synthase subunit D [Deltaproteobacteria bacterium]